MQKEVTVCVFIQYQNATGNSRAKPRNFPKKPRILATPHFFALSAAILISGAERPVVCELYCRRVLHREIQTSHRRVDSA